MAYKKGCIVMHSRTQFSDGSFDPHAERPTMIAIGTDSITNETYYLTITSQVRHYLNYPDKYFSLEEDLWREVGLQRPSLINLETVYKDTITGRTKGGLPPRLYKEVIAKLKEYKETHPDKIFDEIKGKL